jgi:hypothetical protein
MSSTLDSVVHHPAIGVLFDILVVMVFAGLLAHHDIDKTLFAAVVGPLVGARVVGARKGGGGSAALALLIAGGCLLLGKDHRV